MLINVEQKNPAASVEQDEQEPDLHQRIMGNDAVLGAAVHRPV